MRDPRELRSTVNPPDLPEFVLARVAETEADARAAKPGPWIAQSVFEDSPELAPDERRVIADEVDGPRVVAGGYDGTLSVGNARHIARHDPAHVLAWCAAMRAIVKKYERASYQAGHDDEDLQGVWDEIASTLEQVLILHAQVWADHPEFDPAWR